MADWEITATTIYCEAVDDEVTLMLTPTGAVSCTGRLRFENPDKENARLLREKARAAGRNLACAGPGCEIVEGYKAKV